MEYKEITVSSQSGGLVSIEYQDLCKIQQELDKRGIYIGHRAVLGNRVELGDNVRIGKDVFIGQGTKIGQNTKIKNNSLIGGNVKIGKNVKILCGSIIGDESQIGDNTKINTDVVIGHCVVIENDCLVLDYTTIGYKTYVMQGTRIDDKLTIPSYSNISEDIERGCSNYHICILHDYNEVEIINEKTKEEYIVPFEKIPHVFTLQQERVQRWIKDGGLNDYKRYIHNLLK
jgi:UDP-3-O-[3-hydroxymyristoyl] glucosamine N-acyltransferase